MFPHSRFVCLFLFIVAGLCPSLRAEWQIESSADVTASPDASVVLVGDENGFVVHETATLQPRFVVRHPGAHPRLFSSDGLRLYFTRQKEGLFALDLQSGAISSIARIPFIQRLILNSEDGSLVVLSAAPDAWETTALRVHRISANSGSEPTLLAEVPAQGLAWLELNHAVPARDAGHVVLLVREVDQPDNSSDTRKWGDFHFIDLSLADGTSKSLSTLKSPREGFFLEEALRWTTTKRDVLEYASGSYLLIDPYAGKILRELKVPKVDFALGDAGQVIALGERREEDEVRLYRDYLESGTLKTIRNVRLEKLDSWPERSAQKLPEDPRLITPPGPAAISLSQPGDGPYSLNRLNSETGEVAATYLSKNAEAYSYANYAFHPSRPEFFAMDGEENVHLFRVATSGLKHQFRGQAAYWASFTSDGEAVVFQGLTDPPTGQIATADFPSAKAMTYEAPPLGSTDPVYAAPPVISPSGGWIVTINNRDAVLHRFGESPIIASLGGVRGEQLPLYRFAPDESRLARLVFETSSDNNDNEVVTPTVELLPFPIKGEVPEPLWSVPLPHASFVWLDYSKSGALRFLDRASGELLLIDARDGSTRVESIAGIDAGNFPDASATFGGLVLSADSTQAFVALGDRIFAFDFSTSSPRGTQFVLPESVRSLHRFGDGRHLVAVLASGPLVFLDSQGSSLRAAVQLTFQDRETGAYLAQTPAGRFDAPAAVRATGYLLNGTRPVRLAQVFDRDYQPDLLAATLGSDAVAPEGEVAAFVQAPVVELSAQSLGGLRQRLFVEVQSQQYPLAEVALYQNEKLVHRFALEPGRQGFQARHEIDLLLEDNRFTLVATNTQGVSTTSAAVLASPPDALLREKLSAQRPAELHLLVVGVNEYRNTEYNLNFAVADADGVLAKIQAVNRALFAKINVHHLSNARATHDGILAAFEQVRTEALPQDVFIFYFAGHGVMSKSDSQFYLIPHDVTRIYGESQSLSENGISAGKLRDLSAGIGAQKQLFILDACNSGGALQAFAQRGASQEKAIAQLARATGTHWIAASSSTQFATEFKDLGHGAFTHTLLQALDGAADSGDKRITINELKAYLEAELPAVTQRYKGAPQYPSSYGYGQDFPIALLP